MKKNIIMISLIVLAFVLQTSFIVFFDSFNLITNLSLVLLVIFAMVSDEITGGVLGLITGVLYDVMIYDIFGIYTLIYFFIGTIIGWISGDMLRENYLAYSIVAGASTLLMHLLLYLILFFLKFRVKLAVGILPGILIESAVNAVLVIFVLKFVLYLFNRFDIKI